MYLLMLLCGVRRPQFPWMTTGDQIEQTHQNLQNIQSTNCICAYVRCHTSNPRALLFHRVLERLTQLEFKNIMQFHTPNQTQTPNFSIYFRKIIMYLHLHAQLLCGFKRCSASVAHPFLWCVFSSTCIH